MDLAFQDLAFRRATLADLEIVLEMMRLYYDEDHLAFDPLVGDRVLRELFANETLGQVRVLCDRGGSETVGYFVLTASYSLEYGGKIFILDELYVRTDRRGRGYGKAAVRFIGDEAKRLGKEAVRLEVTSHNSRALALYKKLGFIDLGRSLLTTRLNA